MTSIASAYSATGGWWERGPARIYERLAGTILGRSPVTLEGRLVLDAGAGTGAAGRAAMAAGALGVVAVDAAFGMLAHQAASRPPGVLGDLAALPFGPGVFGATVAAFSLNHLANPAAGLREMVRVTRPGGAVLAGTYSEDDAHPVKEAVAASLAACGWVAEPWYRSMAATIIPLLATVERFEAAAGAAGITARVEAVRVPFADLGAADLVAWRLGMAQHAPFFAGLTDSEREAVAGDALDRLGDDPPPLVRSILVLTAITG